MTPTPVVTCFLRHRGAVLLLRRSDAVGSYPGRWGGVSGHVARPGADPDARERSPEAAARAEVAEETGLLDACELVRAGDPVAVDDEHGAWRVHPFLFDCAARDARTNEETVECEWVAPTEILRRETVPALWDAYDRVRPTVATVAADRDHGAASLSVRALAVLRDRAGELAVGRSSGADGPRRELADLADELVAARPGMAALRNRVHRAMSEAAEGPDASDAAWTAAAVEAAATGAIAAALSADDAAAAAAADRIGGTVLTLSRSGTVLSALRAADLDGVVVAESRPGREGVGVAEALAAEGHDVTLVPDAAVAHHLGTGAVDAVVVGADTVLADGRVVNKVGTRGAAAAAAREGVPVDVVAARDKVAPATDGDPGDGGETDADSGDGGETDADSGDGGETAVDLGAVDPAAVYDGDADLRVAAPLFDVTPAALVDAVVTEDGALAPAEVRAVAEAHGTLWDPS